MNKFWIIEHSRQTNHKAKDFPLGAAPKRTLCGKLLPESHRTPFVDVGLYIHASYRNCPECMEKLEKINEGDD